jgi:hypothetical protein
VTEDLGLVVSSDSPQTGPPADPRKHRSFPLLFRLKAALVAAGLAIAVLGGALYLEHRQTPLERQAADAIETYTAAWNAHDRAAVLAAMTAGGSFAAGDILERPLLSAAVGPELDRLLGSMFSASVSLETTGRLVLADAPRTARAQHVSVTQRYRYHVYGVPVVEAGISLFTLVPVNGALKVAQHVWWRPLAATAPSMLWAS